MNRIFKWAEDVLEQYDITDNFTVRQAEAIMEVKKELIRLTREIVKGSIPGSERQRMNQELLDELQGEEIKKRNTLSPFQKEFALQCIKYVKDSPKGFRSIPLGYNLEEDIGLINLAIQILKEEE